MLACSTEQSMDVFGPRLSCLACNVFSSPAASNRFLHLDYFPKLQTGRSCHSSTLRTPPTVCLTPSLLQLAPPSESVFPPICYKQNPSVMPSKHPPPTRAPLPCSDTILATLSMKAECLSLPLPSPVCGPRRARSSQLCQLFSPSGLHPPRITRDL